MLGTTIAEFLLDAASVSAAKFLQSGSLKYVHPCIQATVPMYAYLNPLLKNEATPVI